MWLRNLHDENIYCSIFLTIIHCCTRYFTVLYYKTRTLNFPPCALIIFSSFYAYVIVKKLFLFYLFYRLLFFKNNFQYIYFDIHNNYLHVLCSIMWSFLFTWPTGGFNRCIDCIKAGAHDYNEGNINYNYNRTKAKYQLEGWEGSRALWDTSRKETRYFVEEARKWKYYQQEAIRAR